MIYVFIPLACILFFFLIWLFLLAPGRLPQIPMAERLWKAAYAHRGLHTKDGAIPENSLPAFAAAVDAGYGMELDVNLTADGHVVVFHDDSLQRMCATDKKINDCTLAELQTYHLGATQEKIPLFSEVLDLVQGRTPMIVELKSTRRKEELCQKTAELLEQYQGDFCIESFNPAFVHWFAKNKPGFIRGQLSAGAKMFRSLPFFQRLLLSSLLTNVLTRPHFVAFHHPDARRNLRLRLYRLLGGKLVAWTVREEVDIEFCKSFFDVGIFEFVKY